MCKCKEEVNAHLAQHNTKLMDNILNDADIFIQTWKLDEKKRGKPVSMFATFCPFCGVKIKVREQRP